MSDETNIAGESDDDIHHEPEEELIRHRMTSRMEVDPEIREESITESWYPDRETIWCEEPESDRNKEGIQEEKHPKTILRYTTLDLRTDLIEEKCIKKKMNNISMKKLIKKELSDKIHYTFSIEIDSVESKKILESREGKSSNGDNHWYEDQHMWEIFSRIKWKGRSWLIWMHKKNSLNE